MITCAIIAKVVHAFIDRRTRTVTVTLTWRAMTAADQCVRQPAFYGAEPAAIRWPAMSAPSYARTGGSRSHAHGGGSCLTRLSSSGIEGLDDADHMGQPCC